LIAFKALPIQTNLVNTQIIPLDNMITQLMALPKGSGSARIRVELETIIEEEGLREYARVHTDGSVMDERSGCEIVMGHRVVAGQMSVFNAEAQAII
jgi:hypothetical protein